LHTGGVADFLLEVDDTNDLIKAANAAYQFNIPYTVIGAGMSVLPSDVGYPGLVIINRANRFFLLDNGESFVAEGSTSCCRLAGYAASQGYCGLEILAAFPGTVAGAALTNAAWENKSIRSLLKGITYWRPKGESGEIVTLTDNQLSEDIWPSFMAPNAYRPIVLTLFLRTIKTSTENAQQRLLNFCQGIPRGRNRDDQLGYLFTRPLKERLNYDKLLPRTAWQGIRLGQDPNLLQNPRRQTSSLVVRQVITAYRRALEERLGFELIEGISYLGYWPDGESDSNA